MPERFLEGTAAAAARPAARLDPLRRRRARLPGRQVWHGGGHPDAGAPTLDYQLLHNKQQAKQGFNDASTYFSDKHLS